jgi:hypothetical protein
LIDSWLLQQALEKAGWCGTLIKEDGDGLLFGHSVSFSSFFFLRMKRMKHMLLKQPWNDL